MKIAIIATLFLLGGFMLGCNLCRQEIWNKSTSPNGKWVATTVMRDCGATTSEIVSINVHAAGENKLSQHNNALVLKYGKTAGISWKDNQTLILDCGDCTTTDVLVKENQVGPIKIEYELPADPSFADPPPR